MHEGTLVSIHIATEAGGPMRAMDSVVADRGLEGDRYFAGTGTYSHKAGPEREVTLIEAETLASVRGEHGIDLFSGASRRNLITRGIRLSQLVGREFLVGEARLIGVQLCGPCVHLGSLTSPGVVQGLVHRGGLCAAVIRGGTLRAGDLIHTE